MNTLDVVKFESAITEEEISKAQNNDTTVKEILETLETWKKTFTNFITFKTIC